MFIVWNMPFLGSVDAALKAPVSRVSKQVLNTTFKTVPEFSPVKETSWRATDGCNMCKLHITETNTVQCAFDITLAVTSGKNA